MCAICVDFATGVCLDVRNFTHSHMCEMCTCKMCAMYVQVLQMEFVCNYVCKSVDARNFAHPHMCEMCICKMCAMCMQVLQLCVQNCGCYAFTHVQNFAYSHTCEMCAFFITALLPTAKIQESQFAFLHTYKIAKTVLKEIVL